MRAVAVTLIHTTVVETFLLLVYILIPVHFKFCWELLGVVLLVSRRIATRYVMLCCCLYTRYIGIATYCFATDVPRLTMTTYCFCYCYRSVLLLAFAVARNVDAARVVLPFV